MIGKGDIFHNNRRFIAENVDKEKVAHNITIINSDIKSVYHELFDNALNEYNSRQKRKDRVIKDYYEHIRHSRQEKEFHEVIFQIGNKDDTPCGSEIALTVTEVLKKYAEDFQRRNPHLKMFNAVIHLDEATPHIHIDFVPFATEQKRGLSTRVSLSKALEQQGFKSEGKFNTCSKLWIENEKQIIADIMKERGIEWVKLGTHEEHLSVKNYKLKKRQEEIENAEITLAEKEQQITSANETLDLIGEEISEKSQQLYDSKNELVSVQEKISSIEDDLEKKQKEVHNILNYLPDIDREEKLEKDYFNISLELDEYLKNGFSIMRNKDNITKLINKMYKIVKAAVDLVQKYSRTIFDLRENCKRYKEDNSEYHRKNQKLYTEISNLKKENENLLSRTNYLTDVVKEIEWNNPETLKNAENNVQKRYELEQQIYQQQTVKKKNKAFER